MALFKKLKVSMCHDVAKFQISEAWKKHNFYRKKLFPISVLGCCSCEYFWFWFISADQNKCHQLRKIMSITKICLKDPNIYACFTNEGTGLNGLRFSRTYICPWYFQISQACFCFLRLSNIIRNVYITKCLTLWIDKVKKYLCTILQVECSQRTELAL